MPLVLLLLQRKTKGLKSNQNEVAKINICTRIKQQKTPEAAQNSPRFLSTETPNWGFAFAWIRTSVLGDFFPEFDTARSTLTK